MNNDKLRELEEKIRRLMIEQIQLDKGMPLLKPLNKEWEQYRKGEG